jgi:single-strand DNA-binding protein
MTQKSGSHRPAEQSAISAWQSRRDSKGDDGWKDLETTWFRVSVWGKPGESFMEVGRKGDLVTLAGRFSTRTYEAKDGTNRTDLTVDADSVGIVPIVKSDSSWGSPIDQTQEAPF